MKYAKLVLGILIIGAVLQFVPYENRAAHQNLGFHNSAYSQPEFYDDAYDAAAKFVPKGSVTGFIVNHHLLAANLDASMFASLGSDKPITIVMISVNHFTIGNGLAITSNYDWKTPYGILQSDQALVKSLAASGLVNVDETPFDNEHGIFNLAPFVKKSFPNAQFVPIIIKEQMPDQTAGELANLLYHKLPKDALVIGSIDFSHYLPSNGADLNDAKTLAVIYNQDYASIPALDINTHPGLRILLKYFSLKQTPKFNLALHSNSSKLTGYYNYLETTSYIDGYFTAGDNPVDHDVTAIYTGVWDTSNPKLYNVYDPQYGLEKVERLIKFSDLPIGLADANSYYLLKPLGILPNQLNQAKVIRGKKIMITKVSGMTEAQAQIDSGADAVIVDSTMSDVIEYNHKPIVLAAKDNYYGFEFRDDATLVYKFPIEFSAGKYRLLAEPQPGKLLVRINK